MIQCPVCEHQQPAADECEVCGKRLAAPVVSNAPISTMLELEQTALVRPGLPVQAQPMPELEQTRAARVGEVAVAGIAELERTHVDAVPEVAVLPVLDLDTGRAEDDGVRTQLPVGKVVCRYCRNEQASGAICERCGMRLPKVAATPVVMLPGDEEYTLCSDCGTRGLVGKRCPGCGATTLGARS